jgi:hypothetical protein
VLKVIAVGLLMLVAIPSTAYAYTDPGTGQLVLQMALATAVAALFYVRKFLRSLAARWKARKADKELERHDA